MRWNMTKDDEQLYQKKIANYEMDLIGINADIQECIKLLQTEGSNTKGKALERLKETKERYLRDYDCKR